MFSRVLLIRRLDESDIPLYSPVGEKTSFNHKHNNGYAYVCLYKEDIFLWKDKLSIKLSSNKATTKVYYLTFHLYIKYHSLQQKRSDSSVESGGAISTTT